MASASIAGGFVLSYPPSAFRRRYAFSPPSSSPRGRPLRVFSGKPPHHPLPEGAPPSAPEDSLCGAADALSVRTGRALKVRRRPEADSLHMEEVDAGAARSISSGHVNCTPLEWLCGYMRRDITNSCGESQRTDGPFMLSSDEENAPQVPTQAQSVVEGTGTVVLSEYKPTPDIDYLQELLAIQQQGPRAIGFFGTRNMGFMHQQLIEILSYAMVITKNHIFTSGASGTNAAVIRGALRAEKPDLLTVILPQSLKKQPPESQELLAKVKNLIEKPQYDHLPLIEASRLCNMDIISKVQQVICFAFHDSKLLMETCQEAKNLRKIVTLFYLD